MEVRFIGQPFDAQIGDRLSFHLNRADSSKLWATVAWGKTSGLGRIGNSIQSLKAKEGASIELILGIDQGGATIEGLKLARTLSTDTAIFHNPSRSPSRTFHPKLYVVEGADWSVAIIGSGNLTMGGLFTNYEAAVEIEIRGQDDLAGQAWLAAARQYFESLREDSNSCRSLTLELIDEMTADPSLLFSPEGGSASARSGSSATQSSDETPDGSIFDKSTANLAGAPTIQISVPRSGGAPQNLFELVATPLEAPEQSSSEEAEPSAEAALLSFYKRLGKFDVSLTSAPGQIIIPIGFVEFFGELTQELDGGDEGPSQWASTFTGTFIDGHLQNSFDDARVIMYKPGSTAPRSNTELRFTFHDRLIHSRLEIGDYLLFSRTADDQVVVKRSRTAPGPQRYSWLH